MPADGSKTCSAAHLTLRRHDIRGRGAGPGGGPRRGLLIAVSEGGNHTKVQLGDRRAVLPRHPKDLKPGTFHAILKQLGLTAADLED